ncbi:Pre-mRNA-splicing factor cwf16 [Tilletia horrida]|uniref:Splicing factor YJU2 n=1 Tax=Tilletia horrida TaxID=155126 RepID=A0AAN6GNW1_9BASI|nr:Pre-mRNA-splicing factor cwf16 [Tilletia horrida]KAK0549318.1 Pre-mRNA-splicing factor cwf16 [Tilletia horrida]KAK0564144.1 Pre-mRNA-splicing factor cwf16 [Tilletia horrida]
MSERKVLNKYFPPDFDPSKIPRRKMAADRQQVVRLMAPYSMRCNTCGEYIYKGKKFNARKETVLGETYYGIKIFRFYIKCTRCSAEITFKTDPKSTDYVAEHGASRNFEPWREKDGEEEEDPDADPLAHLIEEEEGQKKDKELDPMKALEARTLESKREMEVLDALQDIQTRNARNERTNTDALLADLAAGKGKERELDPEAEERKRQEAEDEVLVRKYFSKAEDIPTIELPFEDGDAEDAMAERGMGNEEGAAAGSSKSNGHAQAPSYKPTTVKRAVDEIEPEVASLLSDRAKSLLAAEGSRKSSPISSSKLPPSISSSLSSKLSPMAVAGPAKKKQKGNPLGIVRKK